MSEGNTRSFGLSREELVSLLRVRPLLALCKFLFLAGLWVLIAGLVVHTSSYWLKLPLWIACGFVINGIVQLEHDAWHGNLFRRRWQNDLFGHSLSLVVGIAYEPLRHDHLLHHTFNRTERDPDAYNVGRRSFALSALYYAVVLLGLPLSIIHFNFLYPWRYFPHPKLKRHALVLLGYGLFYLAIYLVIRRYQLGSVAWQAWLIPLLFASPWNGLKSISDHYSNDWKGARFRTATTTRSNSWMTFFWNGLNYHLDHHLFPRIPGYNLPSLHARIRPTLLAKQAPLFESYAQVMWRALRAGPTVVP